MTFSCLTRFGENQTFEQVKHFFRFYEGSFFFVMGNKSETKRWLYEPFSSPRWKDSGVKRYGMAFFRILRKSRVLNMEEFLGTFSLPENLNTVNSVMTLQKIDSWIRKNCNEGRVISDKIKRM